MANVDPKDPFTDWNSMATMVAKNFRSETYFQHPHFTKYHTFIVKLLVTGVVIFDCSAPASRIQRLFVLHLTRPKAKGETGCTHARFLSIAM